MWGCEPAAASLASVLFVSQASIDNGEFFAALRGSIYWLTHSGTVRQYGLKKKAEAVKKCRDIGKKDMKLNDAMPEMHGKYGSAACIWADMSVDPETYVVMADGVLCDAPPATTLPLTKKHFIY
jgi:urease